MTDKKIWFITGAGRGMGVDIAKAALAAGHPVVATGRNPERVSAALGAHDDLLAVKLDVTDPTDAQAAVRAAVQRFGCIDVLVNNAGNFYAGFFEEITPGDFRAQVETTLFGPMNVTRAVLPVMRTQRSGLVVAITSTAGIVGQEFCTAYAAAKFGVEGGSSRWLPRWRRSDPHHAGRARLFPHRAAQPGVDQLRGALDRGLCRAHHPDRGCLERMNGQQGGDPAKLASALIQLASRDEPPRRWVAGADAIATVEQKAKDLLAQADAYRELSSSLAYSDASDH